MQTNNGIRKSLQNGIYTLAESGTKEREKSLSSITLQGTGSDLLNEDFLLRKGKKKLIGQTLVLNLIDLAKETGDSKREKSLWNTYHCQNKLISSNYKIYGKYCKNKFCPTCCGIRKADIINRYHPVLKTWRNPYFVTLTFKSCKSEELRRYMIGMKKNFKKILNRCKKRNQRGKGIKIMGIHSLEANFNPQKRTYNPHFHIIVPNYETAKLLKKEWLSQNRPTKKGTYKYKFTNPKGQDIRKIKDLEHHLVEVIKYGTKIFTQPDSKSNKTKTPPNIYLKALEATYKAMEGIRLFDRFGFNLPSKEKITTTTIAINHEKWIYDLSTNDWINKSAGELLTGFTPTAKLNYLLSEQVNKKLF